MPFPVPHQSVPVVDLKTGKITWEWMQFFAQQQDGIQGFADAASVPAVSSASKLAAESVAIAVQALTDRSPIARTLQIAEEARSLAQSALTRQSIRVPMTDFIPLPFRKQWSVFELIRDTIANQGNYLAPSYPDAYYIATGTYQTFYSSAGAWMPIYAPALLVMLAATTAQGALKSGASGGVGILMSRLGDDSTFADVWVLDEAYGATWSGSLAVPTKNALYTKIQALDGRYTPLFDHFADAGNLIATGETDLYSDTLAAGQFATNGDKVIGDYGGVFVGAATSTQQLKVYVGGTACFDSGALAIGAATTDNWAIRLFVIRVSSTILRVEVVANTDFAALGSPPKYTAVTGLTLANTQVIKITGTAGGVSAADNQIIAKLSRLAYSKAA